jgi:RimJ/RimL family protein N-acetyltransferase
MIRDVTAANLEVLRDFLEGHVDTSLFLLSTLAALGPRLSKHPNSGNFKVLEENERIVAAFCLTRRGNLLVQTGGRADLTTQILSACRSEDIGLRGVVGEWTAVEPLWNRLLAEPRFEPLHSLQDVLYRLDLPPATTVGNSTPQPDAVIPGLQVRTLRPDDFAEWERLNTEYFREMRLPVDATFDQRREDYLQRVRARLWWGAFDASRAMISIASLNATYGSVGQIGGVFTRPGDRQKGASRAVLQQLIRDCTDLLEFERLILFTGIENPGARRLYESLHFTMAGRFGLLMGRRR